MAGTFAPGAGMRAIYVSTKNLYFHKTMGFERQNDRDRTKRSRPPFVGYELLIIITICQLFYGFSFSFSFSSFFSSSFNAMALFEIARLCSASGVNV